MENKLKNRIAKYVDEVGVEEATDISNRYIVSNVLETDRLENPNVAMAGMIVHLAILEYLYCDSDIVKKTLKLFP